MAGDERIRLFCALQLPDDAIVTLAFLGHRPADELEAIARELRAAAAASAPLELRPARYRETRQVGMIVLDDPTGAAAALAADLQDRLGRLGAYRSERRRWLPHVTVLRSRSGEGQHPHLANTCSIHVVRSALYRSSLEAGGARYDALEMAALGGR